MLPTSGGKLTSRGIPSDIRIPPETLIEIIENAVRVIVDPTNTDVRGWEDPKCFSFRESFPSYRLCDFMLVSRLWHQLILDTPRLWVGMLVKTSFSLSEALEAAKESRSLSHCLARSKGLPLSIILRGEPGNIHPAIRSALVDSCHRWQSLHVLYGEPEFSKHDGMPKLATLRIDEGISQPITLSAGALTTLILGAAYDPGRMIDDGASDPPRLEDLYIPCSLAAFKATLGQYPQLASLSCTQISFTVNEFETQIGSQQIFSFNSLPCLRKLEWQNCILDGDPDSQVLLELLRVSSSLNEAILYLPGVKELLLDGQTLSNPAKRLKIILSDPDDALERGRHLSCLISFFPLLETICWSEFDWLECGPPPLGSPCHLVGTLSGNKNLGPNLRHLEFEGLSIDLGELFTFCRERERRDVSDERIYSESHPLRISTRDGCVDSIHEFQDPKLLPCVEFMKWIDFKDMIQPRFPGHW